MVNPNDKIFSFWLLIFKQWDFMVFISKSCKKLLVECSNVGNGSGSCGFESDFNPGFRKNNSNLDLTILCKIYVCILLRLKAASLSSEGLFCRIIASFKFGPFRHEMQILRLYSSKYLSLMFFFLLDSDQMTIFIWLFFPS